MGRRQRHTPKNTNGNGEIRAAQREISKLERENNELQLQFYDDHSESEEMDPSSESEEETFNLDLDTIDEELAEIEQEKSKLSTLTSKWGNSKKDFYSADTATDEEAELDEEEAAMELQKKQTQCLSHEDYGMEPVSDMEGDEEVEPVLDSVFDANVIETLPRDFVHLKKSEKRALLHRIAPELVGLHHEMNHALTIVKDQLTPAITKINEMRKIDRSYQSGLRYLVTRQNLYLNYIENIAFYMLLRAEGKPVANHPVLQHILLVKRQMDKLSTIDIALSEPLQRLLSQDFNISQITASRSSTVNETSHHESLENVSPDPERKEAEEFYRHTETERKRLLQLKEKVYTGMEPIHLSSDEDDAIRKRSATHQIVKNKGLKAHKNKLNRNPRLKKRVQYRKAVIRRRGQVRDVRKGEAGKYGGEATGIKSNLTKSRKIRN